jgi:hypothetical protein
MSHICWVWWAHELLPLAPVVGRRVGCRQGGRLATAIDAVKVLLLLGSGVR